MERHKHQTGTIVQLERVGYARIMEDGGLLLCHEELGRIRSKTKTLNRSREVMGKTVADLTLDDEHMTVGVADTLQEAAKRLLTISGGIVVVLDDDQRVKGVLGQRPGSSGP